MHLVGCRFPECGLDGTTIGKNGGVALDKGAGLPGLAPVCAAVYEDLPSALFQ